MNQELLQKIEAPDYREKPLEFSVGDTVRVHTKVVEGEKERIQVFAGIVIGRKGRGPSERFTVRRISYGEGIERVFRVKVASAKHPRFAKVSPFRTHLQVASASRLKNNKSFKKLNEAIAEYEKNKAKRMRVSLKKANKQEQIKEKKEREELKKKEDELPKDAYGNYINRLEDDVLLQETVQIMTDYVRLIKKEQLGRTKILGLKKDAKPKKKTASTNAGASPSPSPLMPSGAIMEKSKNGASKEAPRN